MVRGEASNKLVLDLPDEVGTWVATMESELVELIKNHSQFQTS